MPKKSMFLYFGGKAQKVSIVRSEIEFGKKICSYLTIQIVCSIPRFSSDQNF